MVEDLANMAGMANARGGMFFTCPKAAHMDTTAYGLHAAKNPMQTATLSLCEKRAKKCVLLIKYTDFVAFKRNVSFEPKSTPWYVCYVVKKKKKRIRLKTWASGQSGKQESIAQQDIL